MPLQATAGAATYDAFGGGVTAANYIEDVFSTYLYTGNGSTQTITNGIDLSTKGGLVWVKSRSNVSRPELVDSARGTNSALYTNGSDAAGSNPSVYNLLSTGFQVGVGSGWGNESGYTYASWTFRKQPKFFDVVTYTGNGSNRTISHSLGSVPGCIIVKRTDSAADWQVYHRSLANTEYVVLNDTAAKATGTTRWNSTTPTATEFSLGTDTTVNANTGTYVAYLFAHDAGGFGASGTDNVISCGSFTTDGSGDATVTLGYEPQFTTVKSSNAVGNWIMQDNMRGLLAAPSYSPQLCANLSTSETSLGNFGIRPTATGFDAFNTSPSTTYIYIAIRRGPMRTPTTGTSVFDPEAYTGTSATRTITSGFPVDLSASKIRSQGYPGGWFDRLRGALQVIRPSSIDLEAASADSLTGFDSMTGVVLGSDPSLRINASPETYAMWNFRRAPGFFDVVCYTGTGSAATVSHNLGVVPEMMIVKRRDTSVDWWVYDAATGNTKYQVLNSTATPTTSSTAWNNTTPTSSVFTVGTGTPVNASAGTYVAYLFATVAGVSKVGSYTGTGTTLQVNCGFTAGARFVLIKRTDSTGDWYVWDSARGIVAGNDPYLLLNDTAAEVTSTDYVDTYSAGFEISSTAPAAINANGGTFIFLAIA